MYHNLLDFRPNLLIVYIKSGLASIVGFVQYGVVDKVVFRINIPKWNAIVLIHMAAFKKMFFGMKFPSYNEEGLPKKLEWD